ncbi:hypothetical protein J7E87_13210 [Streptomyces sp. ISL-1]|nr:hypothetical protein [Streptomyces sp. ISL-1]
MYIVVALPPVSARFSSAGVSPDWACTPSLGLADGSCVAGAPALGDSHFASTRVTTPVTSATFSFAGLTETLSSSAVAAAVRDVVCVFDRSSVTSPVPGTSTRVVPPVESVVLLPSTVTGPSTFDSATGCLPASQTALDVTFSTSIRERSGSPGTCTRARTRLVYPSALCLSTVAFAVATSARSTWKGLPWSTPSNRTLSAVFSALAGACTSLSVALSGTSTVLLSRDTSRPVRSTTALARPSPPPVACAGAARAMGAATSAAAAVTAAQRRATGMRKVLLFKVVEPPQETRRRLPATGTRVGGGDQDTGIFTH